MSDIDKRVVQMEFDNSKFDKNVKKSSATLSKFEKQLKFEDVEASLNVVKRGFSALEIAGITAVTRITNAVINLGTQMAKSLTIDRIADGWQKFGDKTIAVATLAAQKIVIAGKELDEYADKMEGITEQLEKLEWFTNETSYTFNDMVAALGKFTAAGQDLDKSVNAMEGIATWAAMSGANAMKASSAMTQLAQTLGRGYVLRIDWQSIQTLNMDTAMFREQVLNTAVELGKLKKVGSDFITNTGKKITSVNFTETLASKWFTSDILVKTLEKYAAAVEDIYEISEREGISARQVIEKYGDSLDEFGVKAFKAAQETRTLNEAITYVMGTIGSTWSKTFELIIGGYDEAKEVWSDLSDALYEDIIAANDFRNEILGTWEELKGRSDLFKHGGPDQGAFWNIYDSIMAIKKAFTDAKEAIFPKSSFSDEADQAKELGQRFKEFTARLKEVTSQTLKIIQGSQTFTNILKGLFSIVNIIIMSIQGIRASIDPIVQVLTYITKDIFDRFGIFGDKLSRLEGIEEHIARISSKIAGIIQKIVDFINPRGVLDTIFEIIYDIKDAISDIKPLEQLENIFESFNTAFEESGGSEENFIKISEGLISIIRSLGIILKTVISLIAKYVLPIINKVTRGIATIAGVLTGIVTNITSLIADFFISINDMLEGSTDGVSNFGTNIRDFLNDIPSKLKILDPILKSLTEIIISLIDILFLIPKIINDISRSLTGKSIAKNIAGIFERIAQALKTFRTVVESDSSDEENNLLSPIMSIIQGLVTMTQGILSIIKPLVTLIGQLMNVAGNILKTIGEFLDEVVNKTWQDYKTATKVVLGILAVAGVIALAVTAIRWLVDSFHSLVNPLGYLSENIGDGIFFATQSLRINTFANLITSISLAMLSFTASIMIIGKLPTNEFNQGINTIGAFVVMLTGLILVLTALSKTTTKATKVNDKFNAFGKITGKESKNVTVNSQSKGVFGDIAKIITGISLSILSLAISMRMLSKLSPEQIQSGTNLISTFIGIISLLLVVLSVLSRESKTKKIKLNKDVFTNISDMIKSIALMMLSLALSIRIISGLMLKTESAEALNRSVNIIYSILGIISAMLLLTNVSAKMAKGAGPSVQALPILVKNISILLLSLSASLLILSAIKDTKSLNRAMVSILSIMGAIMAIIAIINLTSKNLTKNIKKNVTVKMGGTIAAVAALIVSIAASIAIIAKVFSKDTDKKSAIAAVASIAGFLLIITDAIYVMGKNQNTLTKASTVFATVSSITLLLLSFGASMLMISSIPFDRILSAALPMSAVLGSFIGIMAILNKATNFKGALSGLSIALSLSTALLTFAYTAKMIETVGWEAIGKMGAILGGIVAIVTVLALISQKANPAILLAITAAIIGISTSFIAMAIGINMFQESIQNITDIDQNIINKLALAILELGAAGILASITAPFVLILAVGILALAEAINILSDSADMILPVMLSMFAGISAGLAMMISTLLLEIPLALLSVIDALTDNMDVITDTIYRFLVKVDEQVTKLTPVISSIVSKILIAILQVLINAGPKIFEWLKVVLNGLIQLLIDTLPKLMVLLKYINSEVTKFILHDVIPTIYNVTDKITTVALQFLIKLTLEIEMFLKTVASPSLKRVLISLTSDAIEFLVWSILEIERVLTETINPSIKRILESATLESLRFLTTLPVLLFEAIWDGFLSFIRLLSSHIPDTLNELENLFNIIVNELSDRVPRMLDTFLTALEEGLDDCITVIEKHIPKFKEIGKHLIEGLINGLTDSTIGTRLVETCSEIGNTVKGWFEKIFKIGSPSKVFKDYGRYLMEGLSIGIDDSAIDVENSMNEVSKTISDVADYISDSLDSDDMTIKPVLDLSDVDRGVHNIQSLMSGISGKDVSVTGNMAVSTSRAIERENSKSVAGSGSQQTITNEGDNYYSTFNITTNDPEEFAKEADKILQKLRLRANLAKGGAR